MRFKTLILVVMALMSALAFTKECPPGSIANRFTLQVEYAMFPASATDVLAGPPVVLATPGTRSVPSLPYFQEPGPTPTSWSMAYLFRVTGQKDDRASAGALRPITVLTGVGGKFRVSLDGYGGVTLIKSVPVAAILAGASFRAADQLTISLHAGAIITQNQPSGFALGVSANLRF